MHLGDFLRPGRLIFFSGESQKQYICPVGPVRVEDHPRVVLIIPLPPSRGAALGAVILRQCRTRCDLGQGSAVGTGHWILRSRAAPLPTRPGVRYERCQMVRR